MSSHNDDVELSRLLQASLLVPSSNLATIEDCPIEVLQMFMRELDLECKLNCSLVSHFWRVAAIPLLFSKIKIHHHGFDFLSDEKDCLSVSRTALKQAALSLAPCVREITLIMTYLDVDCVAFFLLLFPALEILQLEAWASWNHHIPSLSSLSIQAVHSLPKLDLTIDTHALDFAHLLGLFGHIKELQINKLKLCTAQCCRVKPPASQVQVQALSLLFRHPIRDLDLQILDLHLHRTALTSINERTCDGSFLAFASRDSQFHMVNTISTELYRVTVYNGSHSVVSKKGTSLAAFPRLSNLYLHCRDTKECLRQMQRILRPLPPLRKLHLNLSFMSTAEESHYVREDIHYLRQMCLSVDSIPEELGGMQWKSLGDGIACHASSLEALHLHVHAASQDPQEEVEKTFMDLLPSLCSSSRHIQQLCQVSVNYTLHDGYDSDDDDFDNDFEDWTGQGSD